MNIQKLDALFARYGYECKEQSKSYRVYLLCTGMYYGAEIIMLNNTDAQDVSARYSKMGYSTIVQYFKNVAEAEDYLFKGFFKTKFAALSIQHRYENFAQNQVKVYADPSIKYEYIDAPYIVYSDEEEEGKRGLNIIDSINEIINKPGAHLIIVEAAAGFGKTCTAFELYKSFQRFNDNAKPLFTELSRNRGAKIFRYVLLTEIDNEYNASISNDLVIYNIKKGRIPLIIDGFDELLSKDIDPGESGMLNEFEQVETMLSTIGELLSENAKVVLTSRRTAIFAGSEFKEWADSRNGDFDVVRFQLEKPNIRQWLKAERYDTIISENVPLEHISNPVLLTYLRNVGDDAFEKLIKNPDTITEKYFENLLNREKERQNIVIPYSDQMQIFENLAKSFAEFDITCENRSFVKEIIVDNNREKLLYYKELMTTKQTIDELAETLTNHALLDRIGNSDNVGFINEFVFGFLFAKYILEVQLPFSESDSFIPEDLIEYAIISFSYSNKNDKKGLWDKLLSIKKKLSLKCALMLDGVLKGEIHNVLDKVSINTFSFENVCFSKEYCKITDTSFVDTLFERCNFDAEAFYNVTFIGCRFKDCNVSNVSDNLEDLRIHCYSCEDYSNGFIDSFNCKRVATIPVEEQQSLEIQLLGKYFKVDGRTTRTKYITQVCAGFTSHPFDDVMETFEVLKKKKFVVVCGNNSHITQEGINYYHKNN